MKAKASAVILPCFPAVRELAWQGCWFQERLGNTPVPSFPNGKAYTSAFGGNLNLSWALQYP